MKSHWIVFIVVLTSACNLPNESLIAPLTTPVPGTPNSAVFTPTRVPIETLLAQPTTAGEYSFNVVVQGENETVFFDI